MSSDSPWIRSRAGETAMPAQASAIAVAAITSRVMRRAFKAIPAGLVETDQTADDGRRTGLCVRVDLKHDLRGAERCRIDAARRQRAVGAGEVVELALRLAAVQLDLLPLALDVEPLDHERALALGFHDRRRAVHGELRLDLRRTLFTKATQNGGGGLAGRFRGGVRLA